MENQFLLLVNKIKFISVDKFGGTSKEGSRKSNFSNLNDMNTKYKMDISVDVQFQKVNSKEKKLFTVLSSSEFIVDSQYSQTINNEKKLIENLTTKITQKIFDKLVQEVNAL